jgi:hypothetical protein
LVALGAASQVRRVPGLVMQSPLIALSAWDRARRTYDGLALRGQDVVARAMGATDVLPPPPPPAPTEEEVVEEAVAQVTDPLDRQPPGPEPIPGYDAMTLGALRGQVRLLPGEDLERVLAYERAYRARGPMLTLLEHRLAVLAAE